VSRIQSALDKAAVGVSLVCSVHCLVLPVILSVLPTISALAAFEEHFHGALLYFILPTSVLALYLGCRKHGSRKVMLAGLSGVSVIWFGGVFGHDFLSEELERGLSIVGSVLIAYSHYMNHKLCKHDCHEH